MLSRKEKKCESSNVKAYATNLSLTKVTASAEPLVDISRFSSFDRFFKTYVSIFSYVEKLKFATKKCSSMKGDIMQRAYAKMICDYQREYFPDLLDYFSNETIPGKDIPQLVTQLNVFKDNQGILRVKCKLKKWRDKPCNFPILMPSGKRLTELIIMQTHHDLKHSGIYSVISEIRHKFWIIKAFSTVKKVLKSCVQCRRVNARSVSINQSSYRDFRLNPTEIPYRVIFVDHIGPLMVDNGNKTKMYLLIITCMWSRAVNLKICYDLSVDSLLRALQMHIYEWGCPSMMLSDMGSSLVRGGEVIKDFLSDPQTSRYLESNGIKQITIEQYPKGKSELGGTVETCVKMVKRLIFGSIRNLILDFSDFEFLIAHAVHMINRRPIAFKEALRDQTVISEIPCPLTPEIILHGYELVSLSVIPDLHSDGEDSDEWDIGQSGCVDKYKKLQKARKYLKELYAGEFTQTLIKQATNVPNRYKPKSHKILLPGDIVSIKETNYKPTNFPLGKVMEIKLNDLGEATEAVVFKGSTREKVRRHISSLIPILEVNELMPSASALKESQEPNKKRPERLAAKNCLGRLKK